MDSPILLLEHTDQATKQMLENVRKRKEKFDNTKRWHFFAIQQHCFLHSSSLVIFINSCKDLFLFFFGDVFCVCK